MLSYEEVSHIAFLARIKLAEEETEKMQKDLTVILDYVTKIKSLKLDNVEPMHHTLMIENKMREDKVEKPFSKREELINLAPQKENDFIKVKSVFNRKK